jgi:hypothetical protein
MPMKRVKKSGLRANLYLFAWSKSLFSVFRLLPPRADRRLNLVLCVVRGHFESSGVEKPCVHC